MKNSLMRFSTLLFLIAATSACVSHNNSSVTFVSVSGKIELPIITPQNKYWLDTGPLFVVSQNPLISYRVIHKDEIEFSGSEKLDIGIEVFIDSEENNFLILTKIIENINLTQGKK